MERGKKYCCLFLSDFNAEPTPPVNPNDEIEIVLAARPEEAVSMIRNRFIDCIVLQTNKETESVCNHYGELTAQFPAIHILVILADHHIELACRLGRLGAKHVVSGTDPDKTENMLQQLLEKRQVRGGGDTMLPDKFAA